MTDGHGRKVDFKNTILILTSNIGSDILAEPGATLADGTVSPQAKAAVLARVQSLYPPELVSFFWGAVNYEGRRLTKNITSSIDSTNK